MKKRLILAVCLLGLLAGCGGQSAASAGASAASDAGASAAEAAVSDLQEEMQAHPEIPEEPTELGAWIWEQGHQSDETETAQDLEVLMELSVDVDGENQSERANSKIKFRTDETGQIQYQLELWSGGVCNKMWYADGVAYLSNPDGRFKAPMEAESFAAAYVGTEETEMLELDASCFEQLTGAVTEDGYSVEFEGVNADARITFEHLFGNMLGDLGEITRFDVSGTCQTDSQFRLEHMDLTLGITMQVMGTAIDESIHMTGKINARGEDVKFDVPSEDGSFVEVPNLTMPMSLGSAYQNLMDTGAADYVNSLRVEISNGETQNVYLQQYEMRYSQFPDGALRARWLDTYSLNGETYLVYDDSFSGGVLTRTTTDAEGTVSDSQEMEDEDYLWELTDCILYYYDSITQFQSAEVSQDGGYTVVTLELRENEARDYIDAAQYVFGSEISLYSGQPQIFGTLTLTVDPAGVLVSQVFSGQATVQQGTGEIVITCQEGGDVLAYGDGVTVELDY